MHSKATREPIELKRHWHVFTVRVGDSLSLSLNSIKPRTIITLLNASAFVRETHAKYSESITIKAVF